MGLDGYVPCGCGRTCDHLDGELAAERVGNWHAVRTLRGAAKDLGPDLFPTLLRRLPSTNDGGVPAEESALLAAELAGLRAEFLRSVGYLLREVDGARPLAGPVADGASFRCDHGVRYLLGRRGLEIRGRDGSLLLRSSRVREEDTGSGRLLVPLDSAAAPLRLWDEAFASKRPAILVVEGLARPRSTAAIDALLVLCAASAASGQDIEWS